MRIALKDCAWERVGDTLVVVSDPSRQIELDDPDGHAETLLTVLAKGPWAVAELRDELSRRGVDASVEDVRDALDAFDSLRLLEDPADRSMGAADLDERHFSNLAFFGAFATASTSRAAFQRRLRAAHVLLLGTGGLGANVLQSLAGLGVGRLTLLDHDVVEPRNFARQFVYRERDLGRSKVARAAGWVREFDARIDVATVERRVDGPGDVAALLDGVDLVVSGIDRPDAIDAWVNEACVGALVPWVRGGMLGTELRYFSVDPGRSACRGPCLATGVAARDGAEVGQHADAVGVRLSLGLPRANRAVGPAAALVGSLVAFEALRYLTGYEPPYAAGATVHVDIAGGCQQRREPWPADPGCGVCGPARARRAAGAGAP
jgi:molybdopterin/thiamine biosynthesis adenylyltransferase